jgi:hypothetical protein
MHLKNKLNKKNLLNVVNFEKKYYIIKNIKIGVTYKKFFINKNLYFLITTMLDNSIKLIENFPIWDFVFIFIVCLVFAFIFVNGYNKDPVSIEQKYFKILSVFSIWAILFDFFSSRYNLASMTIIIILFINFLCIILLNFLYVRPQKNQISLLVCYYESINPILKQKALYVLAQDFIILFQKKKKVYNFNIKVNNKIIKYYPYYISPNIYHDFILVAYVKKLDITDLNVRYIKTTPNQKKIIDFNNILNYLITILQKDFKIQEKVLKNLMERILELNNNKNSINPVFTIESYFIFIHQNHHFIPELVKFWKMSCIDKIENCNIEKKKNLHNIQILICLKQIYPVLVKKSFLLNNKKDLKSDLYIFFSKYTSFKELNLFTLENKESEDIFILFLHCAFKEPSLDLNKFTNDFMMILKK